MNVPLYVRIYYLNEDIWHTFACECVLKCRRLRKYYRVHTFECSMWIICAAVNHHHCLKFGMDFASQQILSQENRSLIYIHMYNVQGFLANLSHITVVFRSYEHVNEWPHILSPSHVYFFQSNCMQTMTSWRLVCLFNTTERTLQDSPSL